MPGWVSIVLCGPLLFYKCVKRDIYGFGVEGIEITEVAEKAEMAERVQIIRMTARHVIQPVTKCVQGIRMTARHVIRPLAEKAKVSKMAKAFSKTARHVM
jgi:hypothetical protein